jgi:hypothetical protein
MNWANEWRDPNTEPYTILHIEKLGEVLWVLNPEHKNHQDHMPMMLKAPPGLYEFRIYYRHYSGRNYIRERGRDELEAFTKAQARIAKSKAATDRRLARIGTHKS